MKSTEHILIRKLVSPKEEQQIIHTHIVMVNEHHIICLVLRCEIVMSLLQNMISSTNMEMCYGRSTVYTQEAH